MIFLLTNRKKYGILKAPAGMVLAGMLILAAAAATAAAVMERGKNGKSL